MKFYSTASLSAARSSKTARWRAIAPLELKFQQFRFRIMTPLRTIRLLPEILPRLVRLNGDRWLFCDQPAVATLGHDIP